MLAQSWATLPFDSVKVASALSDPRRAWSVEGDGDGKHLLASVGFKVGPLPLYKHVRLRVGWDPGREPGARLMVPVTWEAVGGPPIFPDMEGTLHVAPEGASRTRLTLNASYNPPLGKLGAQMDRVLMHRVAQITISDFVARLAAALGAYLAVPVA
jgi:carbon monoxide dehydrogenase subunit G